MRQSQYTTHLELAPLPAAPVTYWQQPAITHDMRIADRKSDIAAANRANNKFLKSAAFKALNNLSKIGG